MKTKLIAILVPLVLLAACATPYYGYVAGCVEASCRVDGYCEPYQKVTCKKRAMVWCAEHSRGTPEVSMEVEDYSW